MIPKLNEYKKRWDIQSEQIIKPGLVAIENALAKMNNPEKQLKIIHVAGTNGKGSTIAFMEAILKEHGYTTGVFSSPAMIDIHDQIRLDGNLISEVELNQSFQQIKEAGISGLLTDFELLTTAAFVTFERFSPDYVLLETGMGGLLDSTNVVKPLVSVITSIALDHTSFLGTTIAQVAEQKAGIIKERIPVVLGQVDEEARLVIEQTAKVKKSPIFIYGQAFCIEISLKGSVEEHAEWRMKGKHQQVNAALAVQALRVIGIVLEDQQTKKAIASAQLAHRFEEFSPGVFLDGAHNPAAAKALAHTIQTHFQGEKVDFIIGMLKNKDIKKTLDELLSVANSFTFLTFSHPEAASGRELMDSCSHPIKRVTKVRGKTIMLCTGNNKGVIVTGSLYLLASLDYKIND